MLRLVQLKRVAIHGGHGGRIMEKRVVEFCRVGVGERKMVG